MSNSPLVSYTRISPNKNRRTEKIIGITPHYMAGNCSIETCGEIFAPTSRQASSNYGIGSDGRIGMYVPEDYRAWTSSSSWNDQRRVTIEVANVDSYGTITAAAWESLVNLCVDICQRNGIDWVNFTGDKNGVITWHCMFAATDCPGNYLKAKTPALVDEINARLHPAPIPEPEPPKIYPGTYLDERQLGGDMFRLYNPYNGQHLFTPDPQEVESLLKGDWDDEGVAWHMPEVIPIYRLYNTRSGDHLWTISLQECNTCIGNDWTYEGIGGYSSATETDKPIYRLYNAVSDKHLFTADKSEVSVLTTEHGWTSEGIAFYSI